MLCKNNFLSVTQWNVGNIILLQAVIIKIDLFISSSFIVTLLLPVIVLALTGNSFIVPLLLPCVKSRAIESNI